MGLSCLSTVGMSAEPALRSRSSSTSEGVIDVTGDEDGDANTLVAVQQHHAPLELSSSSSLLSPKKKFIVLTMEEAFGATQQLVAEVADVLAWGPSATLALLHYFHWGRQRLQEEYYDNPVRTAAKSGISNELDGGELAVGTERPIVGGGTQVECCVCWEPCSLSAVACLSCRHFVCLDCWCTVLTYSINNHGTACAVAHCPYRGCHKLCGMGAFDRVLRMHKKEAAVAKYRRLILNGRVEHDDHLRWCTNPNCSCVIYSPTIVRGQSEGICMPTQCSCGSSVCFCCGEEVHAPATCSMVATWRKKECDESETANWVAANTKQCPNPKCGKLVEKNGGCNHMRCSQCSYEWCWVCGGEWAKHGSSFYRCNYYTRPVAGQPEFDAYAAAKKARQDFHR